MTTEDVSPTRSFESVIWDLRDLIECAMRRRDSIGEVVVEDELTESMLELLQLCRPLSNQFECNVR